MFSKRRFNFFFENIRKEMSLPGSHCRDMRKDVYGINANSKAPDLPAEIYSLIRTFAVGLLRYVSQCPKIL